MKPIVTCLVVVLLLPVVSMGQLFKAPDLSRQTDFALLAKEVEKHSPLMQQLYANGAIRTDMKPGEARALINQKLAELNNDELKKTYAKLDNEQATRIGIILYLMMNGFSNTDDAPGVDYKSAFGGGVGVYLMWTLANFVLMPELAYWLRPLKGEVGSITYKERFSYLTFAFTAMYILRMQTINLLLGLSPNLGYAIGGKYKQGDDDWEDIEFEDNGAKRINLGLGLTAGIMLRNAMVIRLMYNLGLSKIYEGSDFKMYAIALAVTIPIWALK
jgi:hypothetical protein